MFGHFLSKFLFGHFRSCQILERTTLTTENKKEVKNLYKIPTWVDPQAESVLFQVQNKFQFLFSHFRIC